MTRDEAEHLAIRIAQTPGWRTTPDHWIDHLTPLDYQAALTAYHQLAGANQHCPTIAELRATYRNHNQPATEQPTPCSRCDSTGWLHTTFTKPEGVFSRHTYTGVTPCNCPNGHRNTQSYQAAIRHT